MQLNTKGTINHNAVTPAVSNQSAA